MLAFLTTLSVFNTGLTVLLLFNVTLLKSFSVLSLFSARQQIYCIVSFANMHL